jgi:broad specificity phosphatase PhoE
MKQLIFIRHGQTDMVGRYCGHANPPINKYGCAQIKRLARDMKNEPIDAIVTSDLQRAVTTAHALGNLKDLIPFIRPRLREICFGEWEALCWDEIEQRDAGFARRWLDNFPHLTAPHGECFSHFRRRVLDEIAGIVENVAGNCIAVVTHAGVLRVVLQEFRGLSDVAAVDTTRSYCCWFRYEV